MGFPVLGKVLFPQEVLLESVQMAVARNLADPQMVGLPQAGFLLIL